MLTPATCVKTPRTITVIPGDGVGPQCAQIMMRVMKAAVPHVRFDVQQAGRQAWEQGGRKRGPEALAALIPEATMASIRAHRVAVIGPIENPYQYSGVTQNLLPLIASALEIPIAGWYYKQLDGLKANAPSFRLALLTNHARVLAPALHFGPTSIYAQAIREALMESAFAIPEGATIDLQYVTWESAAQLGELVFKYALQNGFNKLTFVMESGSPTTGTERAILSAYRDHFQEGRRQGIDLDKWAANAFITHLLNDPTQFGAIFSPHNNVAVIRGVCDWLIGGNVLFGKRFYLGNGFGLFSSTMGPALRRVGKDQVSPIGMISAGAAALVHIGERQSASRIVDAMERVFRDKRMVTMGLQSIYEEPIVVGTEAMGDAIIQALGEEPAVES